MEKEVTFEEWFDAAKKYAILIGFCTSGDPEDYRGYFECKYTPEEAIQEDWSYLQ